MRFSTIAVSLLSGLSIFKGAIASPIHPVTDVQVQKRQTVVEVVDDLKSSVVSHLSYFASCPFLTRQAGPVTTLRNPDVTAVEAQSALQSIVDAINAATAAVPGSTTSAKRALDAAIQGKKLESREFSTELAERQADDLEIVGRVLAEIITDIVEAIAELADDLKGLPLIVSRFV